MNIQFDTGRLRHDGSLAGTLLSHDGADMDAGGRLAGMADLIGADAYVVLRAETLSGRACGELVTVLDSRGVDGARSTAGTARLAARLVEHMETTLVPMTLRHAPADAGGGDAGDVDCVAFPVKLGALGNGAVLFTGRDLSFDPERLLALHRRCFPILKGLLRNELGKAAPRRTLNDRELACLQLAGEGLKSELIADRLVLSVHTVNAYLGSATSKLDSVNRIQAIAKAIRLGYLA